MSTNTPQHHAHPGTAQLSNEDECKLALQVLQLLDGLTVGDVHGVLKSAGGLLNSYTLHDASSSLLGRAAARLPPYEQS